MNGIINLATSVITTYVPEKVSELAKPVIRYIQTESSDADAQRTVPEIIESRGFKAETHKVLTQDGYILILHRIINPFVAKKNLDSEPILLGHGLAAHSGHWLINSDDGYLEPLFDLSDGPNFGRQDSRPNTKTSNNLGFVLANLGYDVWLLNWRGNRYSCRHKIMKPDDPNFWNFTIDEFAEHDLPSFITYILGKTGKASLGYVGMSQGATTMFALLSTKTEFNEKVKPFIALAPAVKISNAIRVPVPLIKYNIPVPEIVKIPILRVLNYYLTSSEPGRVLPFVDTINGIAGSGNMFDYYYNQAMYQLFTSFFDCDADRSRLNVYTAQANFALTKKNLAHLIQFNMFDEFTKFDYGDDKNTGMYHNIDPPEYDLRSITNRSVALIYCKNDMWSTVEDVDFIANSLSVPLLDDYLIDDPKWSHYDFTFGKRVGEVVNSRVVEILRKAERIPVAQLNTRL